MTMGRAYERDLELEILNAGEPPEIWEECPDCQGEGYVNKTIHVYEAGCGFSHPDVQAVLCETCGGAGGAIHEWEGDRR